jgi:septum formation protein
LLAGTKAGGYLLPHLKFAMTNTKLILASASARRRKILLELGMTFEVMIPDVEETLHENDARRTAVENAESKHEWCRRLRPDRYILAADTIIDFEGHCIGKARSREEALSFLRMFSGRTHIVYTGVALSRPNSPAEIVLVESSVRFRKLTDLEITDYFARVNPMDRAGAYDIDELGESLIESYSGSRTNIMGLPAEAVSEWLKKEGLL